ncbi:MAG: EutP/PduV family microcompartment system protein [Peptococcaceae bacterium]|nr:EutP/PduV family microcompartment system protein [Peptococcaceae bacterium]
MKRKRIMLIGPRASGKTALANLLNGEDAPRRRAQDTIYGRETLEAASAYLENTWMYRCLIALSQDAWCILVLVAADGSADAYSPGFAATFRVPVVGVITRTDCAPDGIAESQRQLERIGVAPPYFAISTATGEGVDALTQHLNTLKKGGAQP